MTGLISTGWQHSLIKLSKQQQPWDNCARIGLSSMLMYCYTTLPPMQAWLRRQCLGRLIKEEFTQYQISDNPMFINVVQQYNTYISYYIHV